ncbi:MAG TPA: substrate-binding domain-containing protein [Ktedonobacteraceae bacterium]|nr:substrate-binding domain-containing protein [Ktedonobacteraceae bacterium]
MKLSLQRRWVYIVSLGALLISLLSLTSCAGDSSGTSGPYATNGGKGCTKVGILMPETNSSDRWENKDHPLLEQAIKAAIPGVHIDYGNALANSNTQLSQAEADLANGDCILVVGAHDSVAAAKIVEKAKAQNVPVIAYDRMIQSKDLNYYVSFDNIKVGALQAQYIADHYQKYQQTGTETTLGISATPGTTTPPPAAINTMMISGSQSDNNALLFSMGAHSVLDPLFAAGKLKNIYENFTPNWDGNIAEAEAEATLADMQNNVQIAYVANDIMAGGVINALKAAGLSGKVLVTGQDATAQAVHAILAGEQSMTVYKPIAKEAQAVGDLVKAIYDGSDVNTLTNGATTATFNGGNIPSILAKPVSVDKNNVSSTVIADKYLSARDVCSGLPPGTGGVC